MKSINKIFGKAFLFYPIIFILLSVFSYALVIDNINTVPYNNKIIVSFTTDAPADATINYGINDLNEQFKSEDKVAQHEYEIANLEENKDYTLKIKSCSESECAETDIIHATTQEVEPFLKYRFRNDEDWLEGDNDYLVNRNRITIFVQGKPKESVYLYNNGALSRYVELPNSGESSFNGVEVNDGDVLLLKSGDIEAKVNIHIDQKPPVISVSPLPELSTEKDVDIAGTVDEASSISVLDNDNEIKSFTSDGDFNESITLEDGVHQISVVAVDNAGNTNSVDYVIEIDSEYQKLSVDPPPTSVYVDTVELSGTAEPNSYVFAFVNGKTGPESTIPSSFSGILKKIGDLLDTNDKYFTKVDEQGNWKLKIRLSKGVNIQRRETYENNPEGNVGNIYANFLTEWPNKVKLVNIDRFNRTSESNEYTITIKTCDQGGDWNFVTDSVSPTAIQPLLLEEGTASIGINYRLEWQGSGTEPKISGSRGINFHPMGKKSLGLQTQNNNLIGNIDNAFDDNLMRGTLSINLLKTSRNSTQDNVLDREGLKKLDFLKMTIYANIEYDYTDENGNRRHGRQKKCIPISVQIDKGIYADELIPVDKLRNITKFLTRLSNNMDELDEKMGDVQKYLFYTAAIAYVGEFGANINARLTCGKSPADVIHLKVPSVGPEDCDTLEEGAGDCDKCWKAIKFYEKAKKFKEYVADRLFCPPVPTFQNFADQESGKVRDYYYVGDDKIIKSDESICNGYNPNEPDDEPNDDNYCREYYEHVYDSACPFYPNKYESSFENDGKSFFDKFIDSFHFCKQAAEYKKNGKMISSPSCYLDKNAGTNSNEHSPVKVSGPCYFIIEPQANGVNKIYLGNGYSVSELNGDDKENFEDKYKKNADVYKATGDSYVYVEKGRELEDVEINEYNPFLKYYTGEIKDVLVDPTSGILRSGQCLCVSGMRGYIRNYKNIIDGVNNCFKNILVSGRASAGLCRQLLSVHVCDMIYDSIKCAGDAITFGFGKKRETGKKGIQSFLSALKGAASDVTNSITSRYGNTNTFDAMFSERTLLHTTCLSAFYGDWDANIDSMMAQVTNAMPVESEAFVYPRTRRFMSINPTNGYAKWVYEVSYGIVAGSDITYSVKLKCSNDQSCDARDGFENGQCDCFGKERPVYKVLRAGSLRAGQVTQDSVPLALAQPFRYDSVVLTYKMKKKTGSDMKEVTVGPYKLTQKGGPPPAECKFDLTLGQFICQIGANQNSLIMIPTDRQIEPSQNVYHVGDYITLKGSFIKRNPPDEMVPVVLRATLKDASGKILKQNDWKFTVDESVNLASYHPSSEQAIGIPGFLVTDDWFNREGSLIISSENTKANIVQGSNAWTARVVPPLEFPVTIKFDKNMRFTYQGQDITVDDKTLGFVHISSSNNAAIYFNGNLAVPDLYRTNDGYYYRVKKDGYAEFSFRVKSSDPSKFGEVIVTGKPGYGSSRDYDIIQLTPQSTMKKELTLTLEFYRSSGGYVDENDKIKELPPFKIVIDNSPSQGVSCSDFDYAYHKNPEVERITDIKPEGCVCGNVKCREYCLKGKETDANSFGRYCSSYPKCNYNSAVNNNPCICGDPGDVGIEPNCGTDNLGRYCVKEGSSYKCKTTI